MTAEIEQQPAKQPSAEKRRGFSALQVLGLVITAMAVAIIATIFAIRFYLFSPPFTPVQLSQKEQQQLENKLERFEDPNHQETRSQKQYSREKRLLPEPYSEAGASREIKFTERELNAIIAKNTNLAERLAIDLGEDTVSVKMLIPVDADFPFLGGKTLRVNAGAELAYRAGRPIIKLKGLSLMGVPMPNAWLGGLKNIDLIEEFGTDEGFWKTFADGVDSIRVVEGSLNIRLKE